MAEQIKNNRTFFGKYRRTHSQVRMMFLLLGTTLLSLGGMFSILIGQLSQAMNALEASDRLDHEAAEGLRMVLQGSSIMFVIIALLVAIGGFVFGVRLSNQIFGPMVPIKKIITDLRDGKYSKRVQLRKNDEFLDIAEELNLLAEKLEKANS